MPVRAAAWRRHPIVGAPGRTGWSSGWRSVRNTGSPGYIPGPSGPAVEFGPPGTFARTGGGESGPQRKMIKADGGHASGVRSVSVADALCQLLFRRGKAANMMSTLIRNEPGRARALCSALLAGVLPAVIGASPGAFPSPAGGNRLWLTGTSSLHDYRSEASGFEIRSTWRPGSAADIPSAVESGGLVRLAVTVPVSGLRSGKTKLDRRMHAELKASAHPEIVFSMTSYEATVLPGEGTAWSVTASGKLLVAGIQRDARVNGLVTLESGVLRVAGRHAIPMSDHGIEPPTMFLGTVRTADSVTVHFDLSFTRASGAAAETEGRE